MHDSYLTFDLSGISNHVSYSAMLIGAAIGIPATGIGLMLSLFAANKRRLLVLTLIPFFTGIISAATCNLIERHGSPEDQAREAIEKTIDAQYHPQHLVVNKPLEITNPDRDVVVTMTVDGVDHQCVLTPIHNDATYRSMVCDHSGPVR